MTGERAGSTTATRGARFATAAVVVGAASILIGLVSLLGWPLGIVAIVLGGLAVRRGAPSRGAAVWGVWLGVAGTVVSMLVIALRVSGR